MFPLLLQDVSVDEATALALARKGDRDAIKYLFRDGSWVSAAQELVKEVTNKEVQDYQKKQNISRRAQADDILAFSLDTALQEFKSEMPTFMSIIGDTIAKPASNRMKDINYGLASCISKLVSLNSNKLSAYRYVYSNLLVSLGAKAVAHDVLAKTYDSMTYTNVLIQQNLMADKYIEKVDEWRCNGTNYSIVFDNLDKHMKAHKGASNTTQNKMNHMVHAIAYESRVQAPSTISHDPEIDMQELRPCDLLPTTQDYASIRQEFGLHIRSIIADNIPALAWIKPSAPGLKHIYSHALCKETEQVGL